MQTLLNISNIETGYGLVKVLWGVNLNINAGECTVLLGVNGAGKTTLLKTIVGLIKSWEGKIEFDSKDITKLRPNLRISLGISYMSELAIFPNLTIDENLKLGGYFQSEKKNLSQMERMYEHFPDLKKYRHKMAGSLSGGQRKMLGVAKTFMSNPKLVIMDEPSSGLSPKFVKEVIKVVNIFHETEKTAMLIAEQNVSFLDIAEKVYVLDKGKITFGGSVEELKSNNALNEAYFGIA